ncbi:MAG: DUF91 domain-containing protein [Methanosarcinaceae archaeon]|nr:DUF91 domain-containing protein [Methanosarcinaceae archaeon]
MMHLVLYLCKEEMSLNSDSKKSADSMIFCLNKCQEKHSSKKIFYDIAYIEDLNESEKEEILENIRIISRKNAIGVVSKANSGPLPISRRKKMGREGILLVYENEELKSVYPHVDLQKRVDIIEQLEAIYNADDLTEIKTSESLREEDIARMISSFPEMIEEGLEFYKNEVEIEDGRIDSVFKTSDGKWLLIEIEIYAKANAIEQILKFRNGFSKTFNVNPNSTRLALVCTKIKDSTLRAAKAADVEVYVPFYKRIV